MLISVVPTLLNAAGISFATTARVLDVPVPGDPEGAQFLALRGAFAHTILEWTAVTAALFTLPLAYVYTRVGGSPTVMVMAVALLASGSIDAFHVLAADRIISGAASHTDLIPFTWAISRMFNAVILVGGVLLLGGQKRFPNHGDRVLVMGSVAFIAVAYALMLAVRSATELPQTLFPDQLITRPFDVIPLLLFGVAGLWLFPGHYRRFPSLFSYALMVSMMPQVAAQLHMAFGSSALFDNHFNIGHLLKIGAYVFPFVGLCFDYMRAHEERAAADEAKGQFLATMSHEMRTPLNAVIGGSQLLRDTKLNPDQRQFVEEIGAAGEALLGLVNDVLDLSRIEAGHDTVMEEEPFDLVRGVRQVDDITRRRAETEGLHFATRFDDDVPTRLIGDVEAVRRVILNLVDNAVKFTGDGAITTEVQVEPGETDSAGAMIVVSVKDTGIGIPPGEDEAIFKRFRQVDSSTTRRHGGSGLGLSISRQLAEALGGTLTVRSQQGVGSVFTFRFPAVPVRAGESDVSPAAGPGVVPSGPPARILVAEDVNTNWIMVKAFLTKAGLTPVRAENGLKALEMMQDGGFEAVIMDIGMPEMDGYQATAAIRDLEARENRLRTPIIALTAHARREDLERTLTAGCDEYLTKPVSGQVLVATLRRHLPN